jgi:hypothetical protein
VRCARDRVCAWVEAQPEKAGRCYGGGRSTTGAGPNGSTFMPISAYAGLSADLVEIKEFEDDLDVLALSECHGRLKSFGFLRERRPIQAFRS